ncbi:MAG: hypothetical protein AAFR47_20035 [Pseudomonadota bacterium]
MFRLLFSIAWTALALIGAIAMARENWDNDWSLAGYAFVILFPLSGVVFIWDSLRHYRRRKSVRKIDEDGSEAYVWIEFDGTERRSRRDPREEWDAADGDGDGGD